jgi:hypothetical protein
MISGLMGGILAFVTMLVVWFVVLYFGGRTKQDISLPFYVVWIVTGLAATVGFAVGPERLMDGFGGIWGGFGRVFFGKVEDREVARRRRR